MRSLMREPVVFDGRNIYGVEQMRAEDSRTTRSGGDPVHPMLRLARYARPHRARFAGAVAAMGLYAAASGGLVWLLKPIVDDVLIADDMLRDRMQFGMIAAAILGFTVAKGIGGYCSAYLMTDVGQRVVRDLRDGLFRHILDQSAGFFSRHTTAV